MLDITFLAVGAVALLGAVSPGPDFAVVVKNALFSSRRAGIATALGVALGCLVHVTYSIIGIGAIVSESILAFTVIKWIGAAYLLYLGIQMLRSKANPQRDHFHGKDEGVHSSEWQALRDGFLTNALNPKATLFFLAVFTQVITPNTALYLKVAYGAEIALLVGTWFCLLTLLLTIGGFKNAFKKYLHRIEQVMGAILVGLACKVALERR